MKSFITMLAAFVITASVYAAPNFSRLTIINVENKNLRVVIDGNKYDGFGSNLSLNNLGMGYHNVKIYQIQRGFFSSSKLIYSSSIFIKPDRQISLVINRGGNVAINESSSRGDNRYPDNRDRRDGRYDNDRDDHRNNGSGRY